MLHKDRLNLPGIVAQSLPLKLAKDNRNIYKELSTHMTTQIGLCHLAALVWGEELSQEG